MSKLLIKAPNCLKRFSSINILFSFFLLLFFNTQCWAESSPLSIRPTKCIALNQGQVCYQTLKINWQADEVDDYCLSSADKKEPWHCWMKTQSATWEMEFESNASAVFQLVRLRDQKIIGEVTVEVAWVYNANSHRDSHWRVF